MTLPILTLADIRAKRPCVEHEPGKYVAETWTGTVADVLRLENVGPAERIWVATRFLDDRTLRLFAVWCAREALKLIPNPDPRSVAACDVAERFANGEATQTELVAARSAACAATYAAARSAAARSAACAAAWSAAEAATYAATYAAEAAAKTSVRHAQVAHLLTMIEGKR